MSNESQKNAVEPKPALRLKVQDLEGNIQILEFSNMNQTDAVRRANARGLRVLSFEPKHESAPLHSRHKNQRFPLLLFSQELLSLLDAGLNLTEALSALHAKERQPATNAVLAEILQTLQEGRNFSDVLALKPQHFPEVYVAMVRAAERTGDLPLTLARYIAYQIQFEGIRKKLISTAIYPSMLLVVGGAVVLFLLGYVVPRFAVVYESSGREMPWLSMLLLRIGKLLDSNWQVALMMLICALTAVGFTIFSIKGRSFLLTQILRLPFLAQKANEFRLARFYRAVSLLLAAGIALPRAMGMVTGLLSKPQQAQLTKCRLAIENGKSLSGSLVDAELASPVTESLIKVGERSGQMSDMLERTARFVDDDFARWMDWASRLLEPIIMLIIGLVVGTVVVLMYIPIFDLASSLQ